MKIYVACDLEGVAGVVDFGRQCWWDASREWSSEYYDQARRLATLELNALVEGALEGGATELVVWDGHGHYPGSVDIELLHAECKLVTGGDAGPEGLDGSFDALFQTGMHAMAGTAKAVMAHSFWEHIAGYWVNGVAVGEIWMNCYVAGEHGVPMVFLSGDRAATEEGQALVPDIDVAIVKEGLSPQAGGLSVMPAQSLAPNKARDVIREAAKRAMAKVEAHTRAFWEKRKARTKQTTHTHGTESQGGTPGGTQCST